MKTLQHPKTQRGFSLVELLMALGVISMLAAVALFNLTNIMGAGKEAATQRNAQQFCDTYAAARAAGAEFKCAGASGILDELIAGKRGQGQFSTSEFRLPLAHDDRRAVLKMCTYDAMTGNINLRKR
jgi:prepilin-type N-terminal cleavage/methylation domain-containing protein